LGQEENYGGLEGLSFESSHGDFGYISNPYWDLLIMISSHCHFHHHYQNIIIFVIIILP
jgi:hypothetical protein